MRWWTTKRRGHSLRTHARTHARTRDWLAFSRNWVLATPFCLASILSSCGSLEPGELSKSQFHTTSAVVGGVLTAMDGLGPDAQTLLEQNLAQLKARPDAIEEVIDALRRSTRRSFSRWKLIYLLGELGDPSAVPILEGLASTEPTLRQRAHSPDVHTGSRTHAAVLPDHVLQTMERRRAVWALEKLLKSSPSAANAMHGLLRAPDREVRFAASFALFRSKLLTEADKAVMASTGSSGTIRVRSAQALKIRTQPSGASMQRFRQKHAEALQGVFVSSPPGSNGSQP